MLLELGPVAADDALSWTRFARRMIIEMRLKSDDPRRESGDDLLGLWSTLIDQWADAIGRGDGVTFRLSQTLDDEQAEFLLHGLTQCMASPRIQARITADDHHHHDRFTRHVTKAFIAGLSMEGRPCDHYQENLRTLGA